MGSSGSIIGGLLGGGVTGALAGGAVGRRKQRSEEKKDRANAADANLAAENQQRQARIASDEDLRRQKLFQNPIQDDEEIISQRKKLLGQ